MLKFLIILLGLSFNLSAQDPKPTRIGVEAIINQCAFELFAQLKNTPGDFIFSPLSLLSGMSIPFDGAKEQTKTQIRKTLHFPDEKNDFKNAFFPLISRYKNTAKIANSLWIQKKININAEFLKSIKQTDFLSYPETARSQINAWAREILQNKLIDVLPKKEGLSAAQMILISLFSLEGQRWAMPFNSQNTSLTPFFPSPSVTRTVATMHALGQFRISSKEEFSLLEMSYDVRLEKPQLALWLLLPANNSLSQIEENLSLDQFSQFEGSLKFHAVEVYLPKLYMDKSLNIDPALIRLGMPAAFSPQANFSGISSFKPFSLSQVVNKCLYFIDENGSDFFTRSPPREITNKIDSKPIIFRANRPFIFFVIDKATKLILLMGRVSNPSS